MIRDRRVLQEDYVPLSVVHRHSELKRLSRAHQPVVDGEPGEMAFLYGPSGTGKTCISRYILERKLKEEAEVNTKYLNCWEDYTRFRVLHEVLDGFSNTADIHRQSTATDELLNRVQQYDGPPYVVVLDEVDQLEDKEVLYDLYRVRNLSMILIANEQDKFFGQLDDRINSRLHVSYRIHCERYSVDELADILRERADQGLRKGTIRRGELELIADLAAGDARKGINILRLAAREATQEEIQPISPEIIESVAPEAEDDIRQKNLSMLKDHQKVLYEILKEHGELNPGELYGLYQERVEEPKTNRTVRNYLQKMEHYNLVEAKGEKRARTYRLKPETS